MWKVFRAIRNFFKAIDDFLITCIDYIDLRLREGKTKGDIQVLSKQIKEGTNETISTTSKNIYTSLTFQQVLFVFQKKWQALMQITLLEITAYLLIKTLLLIKNFFSEFLFTLLVTLPSFLILLNLFETNPVLFFTFFFPIVLYNTFCLALLYHRIDKREKGEKTSLWVEIKETLRDIANVTMTVFMHIFGILQSFIFFFIFALFLSYVFELLKINWTNSFLFWFLLISLIFFIIIFIFIFDVIGHLAFYFSLVQKKHPLQAFKSSWSLLQEHPLIIFFFYILFYCTAIYIIYWATFTYFHTGFVISFFIALQGIIFFSFLMQRKLFSKTYATIENSHITHPSITTIIIIFGLFAYVLIAGFLLKEYPTIINFIEQSQSDLSITRQLTKSYFDKEYGYSFHYPSTWDLYGRKNNTVTIYSNYTGNPSGGIWLTITVSPFSRNGFEKLFQSRSGIITYDTRTTDSTIKITNVNIGGYPAVNYLVTKAGVPYSQSQIHYLIHKGTRLYDVVFTTMNKDVEQRNTDVFRQVINSFTFH